MQSLPDCESFDLCPVFSQQVKTFRMDSNVLGHLLYNKSFEHPEKSWFDEVFKLKKIKGFRRDPEHPQGDWQTSESEIIRQHTLSVPMLFPEPS